MGRLIGWRIVQGVATLFAISLILFILTLNLQGNAADAVLGQAATAETKAAFERSIGLDVPAWQRYLSWLWNIITHFDFGRSYTNQNVIVNDLWPRFTNTLFLGTVGLMLATIHFCPFCGTEIQTDEDIEAALGGVEETFN